MKLLTLNTHSLIEKDYERKVELFCRGVEKLRPDVIALQEVNQTISACPLEEGVRYPLRADNHILRVREMLKKQGFNYNYIWRGMKCGYGMYEEGLGVLALGEITDYDFEPLMPLRDDWKMRYALGVKVGDVWYYCVHTGRWDDGDVPFKGQIERILEITKNKKAIIMGDFNCPDKSEGYEILKATGWQDIWGTAPIRCGCATAKADIDGWDGGEKLMRIDYMFANFSVEVSECRVVFTKNDYGKVSDHYGVYAKASPQGEAVEPCETDEV